MKAQLRESMVDAGKDRSRSRKPRDHSPLSLRNSTLIELWPLARQWNQRQRALAARTVRRLGTDPKRNLHGGVGPSEVIKVLGVDGLASFDAVQVPGKVVWCNFELARQLGFPVPTSNHLDEPLQAQLLSLSLRAVVPDEEVDIRETITLYADKYGGDGLGAALGAGRAGFLPHGNLYAKGIGFTPLFKHDDNDDFAHSHGGVHLDDCLVEAAFGEVNENLFSHGSCRILAVIDQGKFVTDPAGKRIPIGIAVRTGSQLRPAHLLTRQRSKTAQLERFIAITRASGQLVTRYNSNGDGLPDIKATMLRIISDHAETAAEAFRWRMIHGALSASNMEISGAMLDLPTQSTQPRTAPVWLLKYADSIFGFEHLARALHLAPVYRKLLRNVPKSDWGRLNIGPINFRDEMKAAYTKFLEVQLLTAAGLKKDLARRIQAEHGPLVSSFAELLLEMSALRNRGALCVARSTVEQVAVLDVFNLLATFPRAFGPGRDADYRAAVLESLKPVFRGNRFHVAKKQATVNGLTDRFVDLYRELMRVCRSYADEYYGGPGNMATSIASRAAFENQPLEHLYSHRLFGELRQAIRTYRRTGNSDELRRALDHRITTSLRSVDGLLRQGTSRLLSDNGIELQKRTVDGINYSIRVWNDAKQTRLLHVSIPVERDGVRYLTPLPALPAVPAVPAVHRLTKRQLESIRFSFTVDDSKVSRPIKGSLVQDDNDGLVLNFDVPCPHYLVGRMEGRLWLRSDLAGEMDKKGHELTGYVFAIPDRQEVLSLAANP